MKTRTFLVVLVPLIVGVCVRRATAQALPGPGLNLPVDVDGDGFSTFGDVYFFNSWLEAGGNLNTALSHGQVVGSLVDLSDFFSGPDSALSTSAAILSRSAVPEGAEAGALAACSTSAVMTSTFGGGGPGVQTGCVFEDFTKLELVDGHSIDTNGVLYVAREVAGSNGGVTKMDLSNAKQVGTIPIAAGQVTIIASNLTRADQVVWEASTNDLLVTLENGTNGGVKRLDLDLPPPLTGVNEFPPNQVNNLEGLVIIPAGHCSFGKPGELFMAEDIAGGNIRKFGVQTTLLTCPAGTKAVFTPTGLSGFSRPEGMAIGDFNGTGTFGIYFAQTSFGRVTRGVATNPQQFTTTTFATGMTEPDNVVFDPLSGSIFVSEDQSGTSGRIWRLKPNGTKVLFATTMNSPQGMSFHPSGVMLVSEQTAPTPRVIVLDGWRNKFNRGDANADNHVNISDPQFIQNWLFNGGPEPSCLDAADANDDSRVDQSDSVYLLNYLFGTCSSPPCPPPPAPFFGQDPMGQCGFDTTIDLLGCNQFIAGCGVTF